MIVASVVCLLFAKMKIIIEYRNGKPKVVFKSLFFRYTVDDRKFKRLSEKMDSPQKHNGAPVNEEKSHETVEGFMKKIEKIRKRIVQIKDIVAEVCRYLGPRISFEDIWVKSEFGTGDAAKTGIICGAIWSLTGNVYAFLCRFWNIEFPDIQLNPVFERKCFEIEAHGIIKIRPVHIITAIIRGVKVYDKYKQEKGVENNGRTTSCSGLDVHSDAKHQRND